MSNVRYTDWHAEPSITTNLLRGILNAVEQGLADEGMPLTDEQIAFFAKTTGRVAA